MNSPKHVAIIMDGNGRWGLKKKIKKLWPFSWSENCGKYYISGYLSEN